MGSLDRRARSMAWSTTRRPSADHCRNQNSCSNNPIIKEMDMAITLEKRQTISLEKTAGSTLRNVRLGLGWDAAKPSGFFGKLLGGEEIDLDASCIVADAA